VWLTIKEIMIIHYYWCV